MKTSSRTIDTRMLELRLLLDGNTFTGDSLVDRRWHFGSRLSVSRPFFDRCSIVSERILVLESMISTCTGSVFSKKSGGFLEGESLVGWKPRSSNQRRCMREDACVAVSSTAGFGCRRTNERSWGTSEEK